MTVRAPRKANIVHRIKIVRDGAEPSQIDGFEVLKRLKTDPRTKMIPVVVLTSSREQRDLIEAYQLGVNSYIVNL